MKAEIQLRFDGIKLNILTFKGKSDPDAYLEWEINVEHGMKNPW